MKVIVVDQDRSKTRSFSTSGRKLAITAAVALIGSMFMGGGAVYSWLTYDQEQVLTDEGLRNWKQTLSKQQIEVEQVRSDAERQIDALTLRLAELQGRLTRLDALGERLTTKANLDDGEFDFNELPPVGGPEDGGLGDGMYGKPKLLDVIDQLALQIDNREQQLDLLDSLLSNRTLYDESFLAGLPARKGWLSSRFGRRTDPFTGKAAWHNGIDYAGKRGSDIISVASGVIVWSGNRSGYGLLVEVNHGNGYITRYAHNQESVVKVGEVVARGQAIAKMGSSGRSTGPHVHFEVLKNGKAQDPVKYMYRASK
ncbi:hypothetical protein ACH42_17565 [Endozoicomonas sp. (ex Bugula neritina AB1)]|nr:hypothetical protein ACH42_17565 [Endozoicomonas sp. (ex Bugula neritina AB1)]